MPQPKRWPRGRSTCATCSRSGAAGGRSTQRPLKHHQPRRSFRATRPGVWWSRGPSAASRVAFLDARLGVALLSEQHTSTRVEEWLSRRVSRRLNHAGGKALLKTAQDPAIFKALKPCLDALPGPVDLNGAEEDICVVLQWCSGAVVVGSLRRRRRLRPLLRRSAAHARAHVRAGQFITRVDA